MNLLKGDCSNDLKRGVWGCESLIVLLKQNCSSLGFYLGRSSKIFVFFGFLVLLRILDRSWSLGAYSDSVWLEGIGFNTFSSTWSSENKAYDDEIVLLGILVIIWWVCSIKGSYISSILL